MGATLPASAAVEPASDWKCTAITEVSIDERIAACSSALESGKFGRQAELRAHFKRAAAHYKKGEFERAIADYSAVIELHPKNIYALSEAATQVDMSKWPAPVVRLFLGEMTVEDVLAAADDANPEKKKGQICEANFYTAELALQRGQREEARRLFELATADCPKTFVEWQAAGAELKALDVKP